MKGKKKAIILDMDQTLESGIFQSLYGAGSGSMMVLRPNLDELISKLQEAKKQDIDIVLCTTARETWVERFLKLKPEFRELFDRILTRDNQEEWNNYDEETNPLEYEAKQKDYDLRNSKPVTTFGYDFILFIDDNKVEADRLKRLFEITGSRLQKDVTYFSGFGFNGGSIYLSNMLKYKIAASQNLQMSQKLEEYLETEKNNPGCHMMCSAIDTFINKDFSPGLTILDEDYSKEYEMFKKQISSLMRELREFEKQSKGQIEENENLSKFSNDKLIELLKEYLNSDRHYPYEEMEVAQLKNSKREQLSELVQQAISTQVKLDEAQNLENSFKQQPKSPEL